MADFIRFSDPVPALEFRIGQPYKAGKGRPIYINYRGETPTLLTPKLKTPFGLDKFIAEDSPSSAAKYSFALSMPEGLPEADALRKFIAEVERQCVDFAHSKQAELFGEKEPFKPREIIADRFSSCIACSAGWEPRMKVKLNTDRNGGFAAVVYGPQKEVMTVEEICKGDHLGAIVEIGPMWLVDKRCGLALVAKQVRRWPGGAQGEALRACVIPDYDSTAPSSDDVMVGYEDYVDDDLPPAKRACSVGLAETCN